MPTNAFALQNAEAVRSAVQQQIQIDKALADANKYASLGYLYTPDGANAYDAYRRVLSINPDNLEANEGIQALLDKLSAKVWGLVGEAKFEQAQAALARPFILMPDNERLLSMRQAVDDVVKAQGELPPVTGEPSEHAD